MTAFLRDSTATETAVAQLVAAAVARGLGGLGIDWEGGYEFDRNCTQLLVAFLARLRTALRAAIPGATISITVGCFFNPPWVHHFDVPVQPRPSTRVERKASIVFTPGPS